MEVNKSKSISQMTIKELNQLNDRLSLEREIGRLIFELRRNAGERHDYDNPPKIDSNTPINQLYHEAVDLKDKTINGLSMMELRDLRDRLSKEVRAQEAIYDLKRQSGENWDYDTKPTVDTTTPINQLYHHGVLGMKWGVRKDRRTGTSKRPGNSKGDKSTTKKTPVPKAEDFLESRRFKAKAVAGLNNAELKKLNERLNLEKQYKDLTKAERQKGKTFVSKALSSGLEQTTTTLVAGASLLAVRKAIEHFSPEAADQIFPKSKKKKKS